MAHTDLLKAAGEVIETEANLPEMSRMAQARYRGKITRLLKDDRMAEYPEIREYIEGIAQRLGPTQSGKAKMTAESVEREFHAEFSDMDTGKRGAFKAKVSRLRNAAEAANDRNSLKRLERLTAEIEKVEKELAKAEAEAEAERVRMMIREAKGKAE